MLGRGRVGDLGRGRVTVTVRGRVGVTTGVGVRCRVPIYAYTAVWKNAYKKEGRGLVEIYSGVRCGVALWNP